MLRCEINAFMNYAYKFSFLPRTITDWNSLHPEAYRATTPDLTSCFGLMTDSAVVDSALVDVALRKSGLI